MSSPNRFTFAAGSGVYTVAAVPNVLVHGMADGKNIVYTSVPMDWLTKPPEHAPITRQPAWPHVTWTAPVGPPPPSGVDATASHPDDDHVITPGTGALTVQGEAPTLTVDGTVDGRLFKISKELLRLHMLQNEALRELTRRDSVLPWLESAAVFIPKSIREPFVGDLREDMTGKLAAGWSPAWVKCVAISQVVILTVRWLWSAGLFRARRGGS